MTVISQVEYTERPRPNKRPVKVVQVYVVDEDGNDYEGGTVWAAVDKDNRVITLGTDIERVSTGAFHAGFRIAPQDEN